MFTEHMFIIISYVMFALVHGMESYLSSKWCRVHSNL